jgi:putative DNA primase/helicase
MDDTGNRRFWPVKCGSKIDIAKLKRDRDQLWAEAVVRFRAGEPWWLDTSELEEAAEIEQRARVKADEWIVPILQFVADHKTVTQDQIREHLGMKKENWTHTCENRVSQCLRADGWEHFKLNKQEDGSQPWGYRKL